MTCAVEGHLALAQPDVLAVVHGVEGDLLPEALTQNAFTQINGPVFPATRSGVVGMGMGDQGPGHGTPGIDPCIGCSAVQTLGRVFDHARTVSIRSDDAFNMHPEEEQDFRESWVDVGSPPPRPAPPHFQFKEAGVERFNDLYDDGYDDD